MLIFLASLSSPVVNILATRIAWFSTTIIQSYQQVRGLYHIHLCVSYQKKRASPRFAISTISRVTFYKKKKKKVHVSIDALSRVDIYLSLSHFLPRIEISKSLPFHIVSGIYPILINPSQTQRASMIPALCAWTPLSVGPGRTCIWQTKLDDTGTGIGTDKVLPWLEQKNNMSLFDDSRRYSCGRPTSGF